jgi:hypothetical protein
MLKITLATAALLSVLPVQAQISVGSPAFTYNQDFDSLTTTAATNVPWANDSTLTGWSLFNSLNAAITTYGADNGGNNTGTFRSYGSTGSAERALGSVASGGAYFGSPASGAVAGFISVAFSNGTGGALSAFTIGYDGEQWRNGGNTSAQPLTMQYGFGASFGAVATWTALGPAFDFNSPVVGATATALDGNAAANRATLGGSVSTSWAAGDTLWLRWTDLNDVGNDHGLAIDNFSLSVTAVPEPGNHALLIAGLGVVAFVAGRRRLS